MFAGHDEQAIVAQCTPVGTGAIALVRIAGNGAISITAHFAKLASGKDLASCESHTVHFGHVITAKGEILDQVMFIIMRAPRSFTGQDTVEITCHNNPFIIQAIIQTLISNGARLAEPGEFAKRSYLNKKIDIVQAEAINELIHAATPAALKQSLAQLEGSFSAWLTSIEENLSQALSLAHASLEFLDEEISFDDQIRTLIGQTREKIADTKNQFNAQRQIRQGIRVALIGSVNAGKSSLFNALLRTQRAIVTPVPGTTRDTIEAGCYKDGLYWTLIDTAGLRETDNEIEKAGIARSHEEAALADIILLIIDGSRDMTADEQHIYDDFLARYATKIITVHTKADLPKKIAHAGNYQPISCSSTTQLNITDVEVALRTKAHELMSHANAPFLLNQRHYNLLVTLEQQLQELAPLLVAPIHLELVITHLTQALAQVGEISGKSVSEQAVDDIFKKFCVGK